ncbi:unnamed protein product, partial [Ascophyllum nodosum]
DLDRPRLSHARERTLAPEGPTGSRHPCTLHGPIRRVRAEGDERRGEGTHASDAQAGGSDAEGDGTADTHGTSGAFPEHADSVRHARPYEGGL